MICQSDSGSAIARKHKTTKSVAFVVVPLLVLAVDADRLVLAVDVDRLVLVVDVDIGLSCWRWTC